MSLTHPNWASRKTNCAQQRQLLKTFYTQFKGMLTEYGAATSDIVDMEST